MLGAFLLEETMQTQAKQVVLNGSFQLPFCPASVMPLFTPEGHRKWVEGWDAKPVYPAASVEYLPNAVWETSHDGEKVVWTILEAGPTRAEYLHMLGASAVGRIRVEVTPAGKGCHVAAQFVVTGLDARGHKALECFTEAAFAEKMAAWERKLTAVLA